jgi:SAM-dependent methyltransferase
MTGPTQIALNIGASQTYIPGFINIDISSKADVSLDLSKDRLPFENSSVDMIFSYHTLEHVPNYLFSLSEIHRVLKHGGRFLVGLPYVTLTEYNLVNPYHLHNFNEFSFDFFDRTKLKGSASETNPILFTKIFHRFDYIGLFKFLPFPIQTWCRRHLLNVVRKIDFGLLAIKRIDEVPIYPKDKLLYEFDTCLNSRVIY